MSNIIQFENEVPDQDLPHPERIAFLYNFGLPHEDRANVRYYSVNSWICGVGRIADARMANEQWNRIKRRHPQLARRSINILDHVAKRTPKESPYADTETLYLITQYMDANSGIRDDVLAYLAQSGVVLGALLQNPDRAERVFAELADQKAYERLLDEGYEPEYALQSVQVRRHGKEAEKRHSTEWKNRGIKEHYEYGRLNNNVTEVATGKSATVLKRSMAIKTTPRDYLSPAENASIEFVHSTATVLHIQRDSQGVEEISEDILDIKPAADVLRPEIEKLFSKERRRLPRQTPNNGA